MCEFGSHEGIGNAEAAELLRQNGKEERPRRARETGRAVIARLNSDDFRR